MGWERKTIQASAISITSFQGDSQDLFIGDDLGHLAEVMGVRFLLCELNSFFSVSILTSLEGSHSHCPHLRSGKLGSLSLRVEYLRKLSGILFSQEICLFFPTY